MGGLGFGVRRLFDRAEVCPAQDPSRLPPLLRASAVLLRMTKGDVGGEFVLFDDGGAFEAEGSHCEAKQE